ncbi:hypothetical protein BVG19_g4937 [[Candida] boidinii]|nr:hypothetical protein BVG19_g4937 [[Candida] boidinii]OWB53534.1 hypothetical protein B5S27_g5135 [[Candida] boidinii]
MSEEQTHVPAWKRFGLKVKETLQEDPLALEVANLDSSKLSQKKIKQNKKRQFKEVEEKNNDSSKSDKDKIKKPPKRVKLPKNERPPPPEKDQLLYLKSFHTDRENWKFSKQKQNWIFKNIKTIPEDYSEALVDYISGVQGGSKDRLVEEMKAIVALWNKAAADAQRQLEETSNPKSEDQQSENNEKENKKTKETSSLKAGNPKQNNDKEQQEEETPDYDYAVRAKSLYEALTGEPIELDGLSETSKGTEGTEKEQNINPQEHNTDKKSQVTPENDIKESSSQTAKSEVIMEDVEVSEYIEDADFENDKENEEEQEQEKEKEEESVEDKKAKKEKKDKKEKKKDKKEKKKDKKESKKDKKEKKQKKQND